MEQSLFWEANEFSASQETPCIIWNPKVHYPHSHVLVTKYGLLMLPYTSFPTYPVNMGRYITFVVEKAIKYTK
jgi:hypothetical protein